jgi:hypothetical protein
MKRSHAPELGFLSGGTALVEVAARKEGIFYAIKREPNWTDHP